MDWNDENISRLRGLWSEGHSTAEIGRRMGVSKNAVVGKAHRLDLPARPSPIRRDVTIGAAPRLPAARRVTGPTLPPLAASVELPRETPATIPAAVTPRAPAQPAARVEPPVSRLAPAPAPVLRAVATPRSRVSSCCWPIGEPGTRSFRFCDSDAVQGKPYCGEHAQLAYVKVRDRRDEAAA
jgi:GcrA cell cycle regulator